VLCIIITAPVGVFLIGLAGPHLLTVGTLEEEVSFSVYSKSLSNIMFEYFPSACLTVKEIRLRCVKTFFSKLFETKAG